MSIRKLLTVSIALAVSLFGSLFVTPAAAQMERFGPTFTINRLSNGNLTPVRYTDVAWDSTNRVYLVVWGAFGEILGRFVAADGSLLGTDPFLITGPLTPLEYRDAPRVEFSSAAGAFMVIWRDNRTHEFFPQVWGRSLAYEPSSGSAQFITADFMATGAFVHSADTPSLAYSSGSNEFLILYNKDYDVKGRRFNINGTLLGTEIQVTVTPDPTELAWQGSLTYNPASDEYFVVYRFFSDTTMAGSIRGQRVKAGTDTVVGGAFDVDPPTAFDLAIPAVAFNPTNNRMLVVWYRSLGSTFTFAGRMMNADGTAAGSRFTLAPTANYVELDVNYSTRMGFFYTAYAHHDIVDLFGTRVSGSGSADAMNQVTVTASVTGTDYARLASSTDRDEFLVTGNIWWNKAIAQRMTFNTSGISFSKNAPGDGTSGLTSPVNLAWDAVAGATYQVCVDSVANSTCDTSWQNAAGTSIAANVGNGTHYWQVRATTSAGTAEANAGTWFSFTIGVIPGVFGKLTPTNGATVGTPVTLTWGSLPGATFQICIDSINDNSCNTSWQDAGTSFVAPLNVGTYYWHVRAFLAGGGAVLADNGVSWAFTVSSGPPPPPPPPPGGPFAKVSPTNGATGLVGVIVLQWQAVAGAGYRVCWDTSNNNSCDTGWWPNGGGNSRNLSDLAAGTYYWQVLAETGSTSTEGDGGTWWSFTVGGAPPPPPPPPPPGGSFGKLSPVHGAQGTGGAALIWGSLAGASYYEVCIDTANNNSCDTAWQPAALATTLSMALPAGNYYWQVRASGSLEADGGTWWTFTLGGAPPPPPPPPPGGGFAKLSPANGAGGLSSSTLLQWQAVSDAGYRVCWDTTNNNSCDTGWWPNGGGNARSLEGLADGTYYWQVRAETSSGTTEADSGTWWAFTVGGAPPPPPPPPPPGGAFAKQAPSSGSSGGSGNVTLQWQAVSDAGYTVCWDTTNNNSCDTAWWPNGGGNGRNLVGLTPGTYFWQVRAQTASGTSEADNGAWWSFTVTAGSSFAKLAPGNGTSSLGSTVSLQWTALADAGYWVCWDNSNNNSCDSAWWPNGGGNGRTLTGLAAGTYYWQVRAQDSSGLSEADAGAWFSFTVTGPEALLAFVTSDIHGVVTAHVPSNEADRRRSWSIDKRIALAASNTKA